MNKIRDQIKPNAVYTIKETAALLNVHYNTVLKRIKDGTIKTRREGTKPLILGKWLLDYLGEARPEKLVGVEDIIFRQSFANLDDALKYIEKEGEKWLDSRGMDKRSLSMYEDDKTGEAIITVCRVFEILE